MSKSRKKAFAYGVEEHEPGQVDRRVVADHDAVVEAYTGERVPEEPGRLAPDDRRRLVQLERENRELRRANAILKTASAFLLSM